MANEFVVEATWKDRPRQWWRVCFSGGVSGFSNLFEAAKHAKRYDGLFDYRVTCQGVTVWPEQDTGGFIRLQEEAAERIAEDFNAGEFDGEDHQDSLGSEDSAGGTASPGLVLRASSPNVVENRGGTESSGQAEPSLPSDSAGPSPRSYYGSLRPEPIDVIEGWGLDYLLGNVIKYVARAGRKHTEAASEERDLRKAISYLQRKVNALAGKREW